MQNEFDGILPALLSEQYAALSYGLGRKSAEIPILLRLLQCMIVLCSILTRR